MERLTNSKYGGVRAIRLPLDELTALDWANRLAEYEDTGRTPEEIAELDHDVAMLKQSARHANELSIENTKLKAEIKELQAWKDGKKGVEDYLALQYAHREVCAELVTLQAKQERMIELPCKVGDTVYWITRFCKSVNEGKVTAVVISKFGFDLGISQNMGGIQTRREFEKVYLTREAAEAALKEQRANE